MNLDDTFKVPRTFPLVHPGLNLCTIQPGSTLMRVGGKSVCEGDGDESSLPFDKAGYFRGKLPD